MIVPDMFRHRLSQSRKHQTFSLLEKKSMGEVIVLNYKTQADTCPYGS